MSTFSYLVATALGIVLNTVGVQAKLPLAQQDPQGQLKNTDEVTFDPLAVAAILHNPRASVSAAKLYTQYDRPMFTWPHTMMIGGTLTPLKLLVEHLTATLSSIHPAITLCTQDTINLPVVSDMVFQELPLNFSNLWLSDVLSFKSSSRPGNDFMVVYIEDHVPRAHPSSTRWTSWIGKLTLHLIGALTGVILMTGVVFGVLTADMWALTLFFLYGMHWFASTLISMTSLVKMHRPESPIMVDSAIRYAIYQRPAGGSVVFKGRQDTLETWARMTWEFDRTWTNNFLHWFWVLSGSLAAVSSVVCMVNMRGYMQLGFLGELVYSSLVEILATRITRILQDQAWGPQGSCPVRDNATRTQGIIRATVEVGPTFRLTGLDWVRLGRLPDRKIFKDMQSMLAQINEVQEKASKLKFDATPEVEAVISDFLQNSNPSDQTLAKRIASETRQAVETWAGETKGSEKQAAVQSGAV